MTLNFRNYSRPFVACLARRLDGGGSIRGWILFAADQRSESRANDAR